jgi:hypothetical protein
MKPTMARESFYAVISAAIADMEEHGFDSQERLDMWMQRIEAAARQSLVPTSVLENALREALTRVFEKSTNTGALLKRHSGVSQYTLQMVRPKLRAELDRRILANANLIKLNRSRAIEETKQRFSGWATSIPIGGSNAVDRKEAKDSVRRGMAGLPFIERRCLTDQSHKLSAAIDNIVCTDGGAIALEWRHVAEGPPAYDSRPEHVARHGKYYVLRGTWAIEQGLIKLAGRKYYDEVTAVGEEVSCRCTARYVFSLRDLPPDMLTRKGADELARVREQIARMN